MGGVFDTSDGLEPNGVVTDVDPNGFGVAVVPNGELAAVVVETPNGGFGANGLGEADENGLEDV